MNKPPSSNQSQERSSQGTTEKLPRTATASCDKFRARVYKLSVGQECRPRMRQRSPRSHPFVLAPCFIFIFEAYSVSVLWVPSCRAMNIRIKMWLKERK